MIFDKMFSRFLRPERAPETQPLRVDGVADAPVTEEPDEAELSAQALLENMATQKSQEGQEPDAEPEKGTKEYYKVLADRIRAAHSEATLRTLRFISYCEQQLALPSIPREGPGSLSLLEVELYKRIDTVDRVGGDLKRRWQHCLAEVTVRLMNMAEESASKETKKKAMRK